jgi:hypothetical protein
MKQCWRCRTTISEISVHHIDGNPENEKPQNLLRLCKKCHDFIQGICDNCKDQKFCYVQKLQRCWAFEDSLPPIYFRPKDKDEWSDSHPQQPKHKKVNNIKGLVKIGHKLDSSMISETYLNSPEFLENFVKCDICGEWIRWRLSKGMARLICANCVQDLTSHKKSPVPSQDSHP